MYHELGVAKPLSSPIETAMTHLLHLWRNLMLLMQHTLPYEKDGVCFVCDVVDGFSGLVNEVDLHFAVESFELFVIKAVKKWELLNL